MTQPTTTEPDLTEAMEVWREAIDAASDSSIKFKTRADQAAARVIATALESRDERIQELEGVATTLHGALARYTCEGCPICPGDCSSANPPVVDCPTQRAIDAYRQYDQAILTKQEPKA